MKALQTSLIYKYSFGSSLFKTNPLLLDWSLSKTILVTAYDLLKDDYLTTYLTRTGSTLKEYLQGLGFTKEVNIIADTGIFEYEARRANLQLANVDYLPFELTPEDIFHAYELIGADYLVSPDEIVLQTDSVQEAIAKIDHMLELFTKTLEYFPASKVIPVVQGFDEISIRTLLDYYSKEPVPFVARGGLIPLWRESKQAFSQVVTLTQTLADSYTVKLHSFGLPSLVTIKEYFVDNHYNSLDTSILYYRTAERKYLTTKGFFVAVNKAFLENCSCLGCQQLRQTKYYSKSGKFAVGLYYHNCFMLNKLVAEQLHTTEQVFKPKKYWGTKIRPPYRPAPVPIKYSLTPAHTLMQEVTSKEYYPVQKHYEGNYKILVIQSCTKRKHLESRSYSLYQLQTKHQREQILTSATHKKPARELYFTHEMNLTVDMARKQNYAVDYYFLSAGFGLINEQEELVNYDCSFSLMSQEFIKKRSEELLIGETLAALPTYDLIYLALPVEYLYTIPQEILMEKATEIIFFNNMFYYQKPLISLNTTEIRELDKRLKVMPITFSHDFQADLLKNFLFLKANIPDLTFMAFIQRLYDPTTSFRGV